MKKIVLLAFVLMLLSTTAVARASTTFDMTQLEANPEAMAGVKAGDWAKYDVNVAWDSNDSEWQPPPSWIDVINNTEYYIVTVQMVVGTNITFQALAHFTNGTEQTTTAWMDIITGYGSEGGYHNDFIPANLSAGDDIYFLGKMNQTILCMYVGMIRDTNHLHRTSEASFDGDPNSYNASENYYWDKATGIQTEYAGNYSSRTESYYYLLSMSFKIIQTNLWGYPVHDIDTGLGYATIQEAINDNATLSGHTIFVDGGAYYEHVVVNKSILLIGENKETTIIDGNSTGTVVHVTANNTNISDFTIQNSGYGILLADSSDNNVSSNIVKNNQLGILLISSSSNALTDNIVSHNEYGIILDKSSNHNNLADNTALNNYIGIRLIDSVNNILMGNIASENTGGIELRSDTKLFSGNNTLVGNIASNNNGYGIHLFLSGNNTLVGNNVSNGVYGIYLLFSRNNTLSGNLASNNEYNFYVDGSIFDDFKNYVDISNTVDGKPIYYLTEATSTVYDFQTNAGTIYVINANNVTVTNLTLTKNGYGILLCNSTNSKIENVTTSNNEVGIRFYFSSNNTIISNNVSNNQCGIRLLDSTSNTFSQNTVSNNEWGMKLWGSINNMIHHNNFINNTNQVDLSESSNNLWDNGYPSGGNYWSNYTGVDSNQDGIGDSGHIIDEYDIDHYPLMGIFSNFSATSEYHVQTICNSSISDFIFNGTTICFNVTGEDGTTGLCRICIPRALMNETYKVFVNGTEVPCNLLPCSNTTHSYLYFTYNLSTQEVIVIPEFPTWTSMLLVLIILTVTMVIYKRRLFKTLIH